MIYNAVIAHESVIDTEGNVPPSSGRARKHGTTVAGLEQNFKEAGFERGVTTILTYVFSRQSLPDSGSGIQGLSSINFRMCLAELRN